MLLKKSNVVGQRIGTPNYNTNDLLESTKNSHYLKKTSTLDCQFGLNAISPGSPLGAVDTPNKKKPMTRLKTKHVTLMQKQGGSFKDYSLKVTLEDSDKNLFTGWEGQEEYKNFLNRNATPEKGSSNLNLSQVLSEHVLGTSYRERIPGSSPRSIQRTGVRWNSLSSQVLPPQLQGGGNTCSDGKDGTRSDLDASSKHMRDH
jgi:hypothetical protein